MTRAPLDDDLIFQLVCAWLCVVLGLAITGASVMIWLLARYL